MNALPLIAMACVALLVCVISFVAERQRAAAIRTLATRSGFHYIGDALPLSVTLRGTPFEGVSRVWNVIDGEPRGLRIVAFDCRVGIGKGSWRRTVIAVENGAEFPRTLPFDHHMVIDSAGGWKVLYRPKAYFNFRIAGLMPVEEAEACLNGIAGNPAQLGQ